MFHSLASCFKSTELSLGSVSQLGTLLQDRRAGFQVMFHSLVHRFRIAELSLGSISQLGILLQDRRAELR